MPYCDYDEIKKCTQCNFCNGYPSKEEILKDTKIALAQIEGFIAWDLDNLDFDDIAIFEGLLALVKVRKMLLHEIKIVEED